MNPAIQTEIHTADHERIRQELLMTEAWEELQRLGVVLQGHFNHKVGWHSRRWFRTHPLVENGMIWRFVQDLARKMAFADVTEQATMIAGPVLGGLLVASGLSNMLSGSTSRKQPALGFAPIERDKEGNRSVRAFFRKSLQGAKVIFADDVRYTGESSRRGIRLLQESGAEVIGQAFLIDSYIGPPDRLPTHSLWKLLPEDAYPAIDCPLCKQGLPITEF